MGPLLPLVSVFQLINKPWAMAKSQTPPTPFRHVAKTGYQNNTTTSWGCTEYGESLHVDVSNSTTAGSAAHVSALDLHPFLQLLSANRGFPDTLLSWGHLKNQRYVQLESCSLNITDFETNHNHGGNLSKQVDRPFVTFCILSFHLLHVECIPKFRAPQRGTPLATNRMKNVKINANVLEKLNGFDSGF